MKNHILLFPWVFKDPSAFPLPPSFQLTIQLFSYSSCCSGFPLLRRPRSVLHPSFCPCLAPCQLPSSGFDFTCLPDTSDLISPFWFLCPADCLLALTLGSLHSLVAPVPSAGACKPSSPSHFTSDMSLTGQTLPLDPACMSAHSKNILLFFTEDINHHFRSRAVTAATWLQESVLHLSSINCFLQFWVAALGVHQSQYF